MNLRLVIAILFSALLVGCAGPVANTSSNGTPTGAANSEVPSADGKPSGPSKAEIQNMETLVSVCSNSESELNQMIDRSVGSGGQAETGQTRASVIGRALAVIATAEQTLDVPRDENGKLDCKQVFDALGNAPR